MKKGIIFVVFQIILLLLIFMSGPNYPLNNYLKIIYGIGLLSGVLAFWSMKINRIHVTPEVPTGSKLITGGIYKYIRHPMYSGLILITGSLILDAFSIIRLGMFIFLVLVLLLKINYEEKQLKKAFSNYSDYIKKSNRLIPFIY